MRVSPLYVDVILGPSIVNSEINFTLYSLLYILGSSITSTYKGLIITRIRPLSCGFDSSVGRALHRRASQRSWVQGLEKAVKLIVRKKNGNKLT